MNNVLLLFFFSLATTTQACSFSKSFSDSGSLDQSGVETFRVEANAVTTCSVSCASGSLTSLYLRYGGGASIVLNDGSDFSLGGCDVSVPIGSSSSESSLGWSLQVTTAFTDLSISCSCTAPGNGGGTSGFDGCFSESATVQVLNQGTVAMKDLQLGDKVLTNNNQYQPIYSFGHYHETQEKKFLQIYTRTKTPLEMTGDHLILNDEERPVRADSLEVGDKLLQATNEYDVITKISTIRKPGVYMPLTADGTLVVNGFKASTYVSVTEEAPTVMEHRFIFGLSSEQKLLHWWLSPYRMLCMGVSSNYCTNKNHNEEGVLNYLATGRQLVQLAERQTVFVQVVLMELPVFVVFALLNTMEWVVGPSLAPTLIALLLSGMVWLRRRTGQKNKQQ